MSDLYCSGGLAKYLLLAYSLLEIRVNLHSVILVSLAFPCRGVIPEGNLTC